MEDYQKQSCISAYGSVGLQYRPLHVTGPAPEKVWYNPESPAFSHHLDLILLKYDPVRGIKDDQIPLVALWTLTCRRETKSICTLKRFLVVCGGYLIDFDPRRVLNSNVEHILGKGHCLGSCR